MQSATTSDTRNNIQSEVQKDETSFFYVLNSYNKRFVSCLQKEGSSVWRSKGILKPLGPMGKLYNRRTDQNRQEVLIAIDVLAIELAVQSIICH